MLKTSNINWFRILLHEAEYLEREHGLTIIVDEAIAIEAGRLINEHLARGCSHKID